MTFDRLRASKTLLATTLIFALGSTQALAGDGVHKVPAEFPTIQAAILNAAPGDTVLVADGVYKGPGNRDIDLRGKDIIVRSEHGPLYTTIDAEGTTAEPYRAFVIQSGETRAARIEGFTIRGGATLPGAILDQFNGGGITILNSSPTISNCVFVNNECGCWGGALYSGHGGSPLIEYCRFEDNDSGDAGGAIFSWNGASPTVVSSVFFNNSAVVQGGAIANFGFNTPPLQLINVTITGNSASTGSALVAWGDTEIVSSIIWGNKTDDTQISGTDTNLRISHSNIEGGYIGTKNIDLPPMFTKDGFHLLEDSPCIDTGFVSPQSSPFDFDGQPRLTGRNVDMGADEFTGLGTYY